MKQKIFSVYDSKVNSYLNPFFTNHAGNALRDFERVANDIQTQVGQFPADFTLFEIGEFDTETGVISNYEAKKSLGLALEFVKQEQKSNS